jgi:pSer/pThr/pTyr-binding forkhead associated (FHA) protein
VTHPHDDSLTQFIPTDPRKSAAVPTGPRLVVLEGAKPGHVFTLSEPRTSIGRRADNDLILESKAVSKRHAVVGREDPCFFVEDQDSTNGVLVNGVRLKPEERRTLCHGDTIRLSDHVLLFFNEAAFRNAAGPIAIDIDRNRVAAEVEKLMAELPELRRASKVADA